MHHELVPSHPVGAAIWPSIRSVADDVKGNCAKSMGDVIV